VKKLRKRKILTFKKKNLDPRDPAKKTVDIGSNTRAGFYPPKIANGGRVLLEITANHEWGIAKVSGELR